MFRMSTFRTRAYICVFYFDNVYPKKCILKKNTCVFKKQTPHNFWCLKCLQTCVFKKQNSTRSNTWLQGPLDLWIVDLMYQANPLCISQTPYVSVNYVSVKPIMYQSNPYLINQFAEVLKEKFWSNFRSFHNFGRN